ncbi:uncharacterized protein RCO7_11759 [Rhynchosporium graminicola]|uniref:Integrase catalytic domain-containing protein n=1 Tax=Rhynchosporium graminicola TaxID=2792576 RepID=A0A1E1LNJ7_9HELO|nr:uncharacterized protein RCO7_11759 [Rhynchosporium commune]
MSSFSSTSSSSSYSSIADQAYATIYNYRIVLDSGASEHYTPIKADYKPVSKKSITIANSDILPIIGRGDIPIITREGDRVLIKDVNYVPSLKTTLLSSKKLTNKDWKVTFNKKEVDVNHKLLEPVSFKVDSNKSSKLDLYYKRLLHTNKEFIYKTIEGSKGLKIQKGLDSSDCSACNSGKIHAISSTKPMSDTPPLTVFDIDIAGPFKIKGLKGERYFLTITCRGSRAIWVYALKHKADAYNTLIEWYNMITTQFKALKLDNAGEFKSNKWTIFCKDKGIICEYTSPYSPEQNAHIKNRSYNSVIKKSPFEVLFGKKLTLDYIRVLGSLTYVLINKRTNKFEDKSDRGILVGYESVNNFLVYIPEKRAIISSKNVLIKEYLTFKDEVISKEELESFDETLDDCETSDRSNRVISSLINTPKSDLSRAENSEKIDGETADNLLNEERVIEDTELDLFNDIAEEIPIVEIPKREVTLKTLVKIEGGNRPKNSIEEDTYTVESYYVSSTVQAIDKVQGVGARYNKGMYANAGKTDQGTGKLTKVLVTNPTRPLNQSLIVSFKTELYKVITKEI